MLIVGDLHGRKRILDALAKTDQELIFVGDFLDGYEQESSRDQQIQCLETMYDLVRSERAQLLRGNHDWSYTDSQTRGWCSGYSKSFDFKLGTELRLMLRTNDRVAITLEPDILITHAGVSKYIWESKPELTWENAVETLRAASNEPHSWFFSGATGTPSSSQSPASVK